MAIDREYWKSLHFEEEHPPQWPCPSCHRGSLVMVEGSLHHSHSAESLQYMEDAGYGPEHDVEVFSALLVCGNAKCRETIAASGWVSLDVDEERRKTTHQFYARVCFPPLHVFPIHRRCPQVVSKELELAFALFWTDQSGAMNHMRNAVELLLTDYGISRHKLSGKGPKKKKHRRVLHDRIEELRTAKGRPELADRIEAVKWLGNEGSHAGDVDMDDVLDAFELMESVIEIHYIQGDRAVAKIAREINRRKKPRAKKR